MFNTYLPCHPKHKQIRENTCSLINNTINKIRNPNICGDLNANWDAQTEQFLIANQKNQDIPFKQRMHKCGTTPIHPRPLLPNLPPSHENPNPTIPH